MLKSELPCFFLKSWLRIQYRISTVPGWHILCPWQARIVPNPFFVNGLSREWQNRSIDAVFFPKHFPIRDQKVCNRKGSAHVLKQSLWKGRCYSTSILLFHYSSYLHCQRNIHYGKISCFSSTWWYFELCLTRKRSTDPQDQRKRVTWIYVTRFTRTMEGTIV